MSYILDALKKNQLEQEGDFSSINTFRRQPRRLPAWLAVLLVAALVINFLLLAWIFLIQPNLKIANEDKPVPAAVVDSTKAVTADNSLTAQPAPDTPAPPGPLRQPPPQQTSVAAAKPALPESIPYAAPQPAASQPAPLPVIPLRELSETEQTLYNGFNYTSHIFTDEPSECAIVIDTQRLQAGDGFKGLKVVRITEAGVIFEENRRGKQRHVEVSVIEQWDRQ